MFWYLTRVSRELENLNVIEPFRCVNQSGACSYRGHDYDVTPVVCVQRGNLLADTEKQFFKQGSAQSEALIKASIIHIQFLEELMKRFSGL